MMGMARRAEKLVKLPMIIFLLNFRKARIKGICPSFRQKRMWKLILEKYSKMLRKNSKIVGLIILVLGHVPFLFLFKEINASLVI
jgi:hypothetical protein